MQADAGASLYIPLLERTGITAAVQAARFSYPKLPKLRSQLKLPALRFYFSPARVRRIMRVVRSALPGLPLSLFLPTRFASLHIPAYQVCPSPYSCPALCYLPSNLQPFADLRDPSHLPGRDLQGEGTAHPFRAGFVGRRRNSTPFQQRNSNAQTFVISRFFFAAIC
jgi:hypothetical protein